MRLLRLQDVEMGLNDRVLRPAVPVHESGNPCTGRRPVYPRAGRHELAREVLARPPTITTRLQKRQLTTVQAERLDSHEQLARTRGRNIHLAKLGPLRTPRRRDRRQHRNRELAHSATAPRALRAEKTRPCDL